MIGWRDCTISAQTPVMADQIKQAEILRQWRERKGLSLETAAFAVEQLAKLRHIDPASKKIPRTHASLSRWETGRVEIKELGLELLAAAYGITPEQIRQPPPPENAPPTRSVEVREDEADLVQAFIDAMRQRKAG